MPNALVLLIDLWITLGIHAFVTAWTTERFGIGIREVSIGGGKVLFQRGVFCIRLIPFCASVRAANTNNGDSPERSFDTKPAAIQILIVLSPWIIFAAISGAILTTTTWREFVSGISQWFQGAVSPFSTGQALIQSALDCVETQSLATVFALTAIKLTALNMLPFSGLPGFHVLQLMGKRVGISEAVEKSATQYLFLPVLLLLLSWFVAFATYVWRHAF